MGVLLSVVGGCNAENDQGLKTADSPEQNDEVIEVTASGTQVTQVVPNCPMDGLTQSCTCEIDGVTSEGRQTCNAAQGWNLCECAAEHEDGHSS